MPHTELARLRRCLPKQTDGRLVAECEGYGFRVRKVRDAEGTIESVWRFSINQKQWQLFRERYPEKGEPNEISISSILAERAAAADRSTASW